MFSHISRAFSNKLSNLKIVTQIITTSSVANISKSMSTADLSVAGCE